jgi:hypothetical protein
MQVPQVPHVPVLARAAAGGQMFEGMSAAERRRFLHAGGQLATSLLAMGTPSVAGPPPSTTVLDLVTADIAALRVAESRDGSAGVIGPAIRHADHLVRMLASAGESSPFRQHIAELACDAAYLAGWCSQGQGDPRSAVVWYRVAGRAALSIGDVDRTALMTLRQGWALHLLDDIGAALDVLARATPLLSKTTPTTRGFVEIHRANLLAVAGRERAAWQVFDQAVRAYGQAKTGEQPWLWWVRPDDQALMEWAGRIELAAGYGEAAYGHLAPWLRRLPSELYVETGHSHVRLAKAMALMDEPRQAVEHVTEAHRVFDAVQARLALRRLVVVKRELVERFGATVAGDLDERLRRADTAPAEGWRYKLARSYTGRTRPRLHRADCSYLKRFGNSLARGWQEGQERGPAEVKADPRVRARFDLCRRCLGA